MCIRDSPEDGSPIFARVRLYEYMEIGPSAGDTSAADRTVQVIGKTDADIDDSSTWAVHTMNGDTAASHTAIHEYWSWTMGGSTVYMPTFNKNKDSLAADINGTYEGPDGDRTTAADKYADYIEYTLDSEGKTDIAYYDADDNTVDEGNGTGLGLSLIHIYRDRRRRFFPLRWGKAEDFHCQGHAEGCSYCHSGRGNGKY